MKLKLGALVLSVLFGMPTSLMACDDQCFVAVGDVLKDNDSGLVWMNCFVKADGTCETAASNQKMNWTQANAVPLLQGDWRLPDVIELSSLLRTDCDSSANASQVLTKVLSNFQEDITTASFWTSTPDARASTLAWAVDFAAGKAGTYDKSTLAHNVLLVRDWKQSDNLP